MRQREIAAFDIRRVLFGAGLPTFIALAAMSLVARGLAFVPAYSIDDYGLLLESSPNLPLLTSQGRFGQALVLWILRALGVEARFSTWVFVTLALLTYAAFATLLLRHWRLSVRGGLAVIVGGLAILQPYSAEQFTFRTALGVNTIGMALMLPLLMPRRWTPRRLLAGTVLAALALSVYQLVLHYLIAVALLGAAIDLTRANRISRQRPEWGATRVRRTLAQVLGHRRGGLIAVTVLGSLGYLIVAQVTSRIAGVPMAARATFMPPAGFASRLTDVAAVLEARFWSADPLTTEWVRWLQLGLLTAAVLVPLVTTRAWRGPRLAARFAATVALLAAAIVWSVGLLLVTAEFWPAPRVMAHVGVLWGGVAAVAGVASSRRFRRGLAVVAGAILAGYVGVTNHMLQDQIRLNTRDALKADRIVARLEALPDFRQVTAVILEGASWRYGYTYATADHDMQTSALAPEWSRISLLREISGYAFPDVPDAAERAAATDYCATADVWPAPAAVVQRGRLAIVCLGRRQ